MASALSVAIVGCGNRSVEHMNAVDAVAGLEIASGADAQEAGRARFAERYDAPVFDKFANLLAASVPDVAAICTMEYPRYELTMQAIKAGVRAIVLEKPMARTVMEAREMVAAAESRGNHLIVCHQMRFSDEFVSAKWALDRSAIGTPYLYRATSFGHLMEQGPHMVDMVLWLAGDPEVEWVMGQIADVESGRSTVHPAPAFVLGYVTFVNGARAIFECGRSFQRAVELPDQTWLQKRVQVLGTDGMIDSIVAHHCKIMSPSQGNWKTLAEGAASWNRATDAFYEELRDVIYDGGVHRNNGAASLRGFEIIHSIYAAALARDRIAVSPDFDATALERIMTLGRT
ncbi:MAG: Gfo/Idh/MocA family oxidoreductase [Chloroflexi bacterium]|nr:Gfo/Idh/MocA family oxidoreductase [Chloroflexota bacterium]